MTTDNDNGTPPETPPPAPEPLDEEKITAIMRQQFSAELQGMAQMFGIRVTEEGLNAIVGYLVEEQKMIVSQVLPSMIAPESFKETPLIGLRVWHGKQKDKAIQPLTHKRPEAAGIDPRIAFDFGRPLDSPDLCFYAWRDGNVHPVEPPRVGETRDLPHHIGPSGL